MVLFILLYLLILCLCRGDEVEEATDTGFNAGSRSGKLVLVMSAREHFNRRNVIRKTWKAEALSVGVPVFFVVGEQGCEVPHVMRDNWFGCVARSSHDFGDIDLGKEQLWEQSVWNRHKRAEIMLRSRLEDEREEYGDLALVDLAPVGGDTYTALPHKLLKGLEWALQQLRSDTPRALDTWVIKVDDDVVIRPERLLHYLASLGRAQGTVVGALVDRAPVLRKGKYGCDETVCPYAQYPLFPLGSRGVAMGSDVAEFVVALKGQQYLPGEDTSLGVWLQSREVRWVNASAAGHFSGTGQCSDNTSVIVARDDGLTVLEIEHCAAMAALPPPLLEIPVIVDPGGSGTAPTTEVFRLERNDLLSSAITTFCVRFQIYPSGCATLYTRAEDIIGGCGFVRECIRTWQVQEDLPVLTRVGGDELAAMRVDMEATCSNRVWGSAFDGDVACFFDSRYPLSFKPFGTPDGELRHAVYPVQLPSGESYLLPDGLRPVHNEVVSAIQDLLQRMSPPVVTIAGETRHQILSSVIEFEAGVGQLGRALLARDRRLSYIGLDSHGNAAEFSQGWVQWYNARLDMAPPQRAEWAVALFALDQGSAEDESRLLAALHSANCAGVVVSLHRPTTFQKGIPNNHGAEYVNRMFIDLGYSPVALTTDAHGGDGGLYAFARLVRPHHCLIPVERSQRGTDSQ